MRRHRQEARALDKEAEIDVEAMGRIDFLGHPELRNPFLYGPNVEAWDRGWRNEYNIWMSGDAPNNLKLRGRPANTAAEEADKDTDAD